jgi:hypothetical protein
MPMNARNLSKRPVQPEWVSGSSVAQGARNLDRSGSWAMSSFDLAQGADVLDAPDTITDELFDALFTRRAP